MFSDFSGIFNSVLEDVNGMRQRSRFVGLLGVARRDAACCIGRIREWAEGVNGVRASGRKKGVLRMNPGEAGKRRLVNGDRCWGMLGMAVTVLSVGGFGGAPAAAQGVTTYGTLSNFDAVNDTRNDCHGFEIELEGISPSDVVCTFGASGDPANPYNRYGDPVTVPIAGGVIVRYASAYDSANHRWAATTPQAVPPYPQTMGHQCWSLGDPNYPNSGCEHFGVCLSRNATKTTYRWLIEDSARPGSLTTFGSSVSIPAPVWNVIPQPPPAPHLPPPPPIVIAVIPAPPAPPVPPGGVGQWGEPIWVKIYTMELPEAVEIEDLVLGGAGVPDPEVEAPEIEWKLLQSPPIGKASEKEESENGGEIGEGAEVVSRRYEFYKYTGEFNEEDHEALCDNPSGEDSRCGPVDPETGVAGVGDLIGAQNAAVNLFEQAINFSKSADTSSASVGGAVNYTLTLENNSTVGSPDLECTITDALLGLSKAVTVAAGSSDSTLVAYTVPAGDADPLVNTASVTCSPVGFPDVLEASDSWSVDLVPPVESPTIECGANVLVGPDAGFCSALVSYGDPIFTPADATLSCVPPSGSRFPAEATTVRCTASNSAGEASCEFTVTVTDDPAACDDTDACTTDGCVDGVCVHGPIDGCCNSDDVCTDDDACTRDACVNHVCTHDDDAACCLVDSECTDGDVCTLDACVNHACTFTGIAGCCRSAGECDDGDACTSDDCVNASCTHENVVGCCKTDADCEDGDPCTVDTCAASVCGHEPTDDAAPVLTCPADLTLPYRPGICGAMVSYELPTVTQGCSPVEVTCTPPSGSLFRFGATTVNCAASNGAGDGTCRFQVTVTTGNRCPRTRSYWAKRPLAWPVESLVLGGQVYSKAELMDILRNSPRADASLGLAWVLIPTLLSIADGADPSPVCETVEHANALLAQFAGKLPYRVKTSSAVGVEMVGDTRVLQAYIDGSMTPGCHP